MNVFRIQVICVPPAFNAYQHQAREDRAAGLDQQSDHERRRPVRPAAPRLVLKTVREADAVVSEAA